MGCKQKAKEEQLERIRKMTPRERMLLTAELSRKALWLKLNAKRVVSRA